MNRAVELRRLLTLSILVLFGVVLIRTAWMSDDAYITLRTVDNFVSGLGPRWNADERVQAFTHPLWLLVLSVPYAVTREAYFTPYAVMTALALVTVWMFLVRIAVSAQLAAIGGAALIFSKAFVEYSTSGLENPLTHLLLGGWLLSFWRIDVATGRGLTPFWLGSGLLMLNRLDLSVLVAPALVITWWRAGWRRSWRAAAIGLSPLFAWELFAIVYYGFPFPNTAYAKLPSNVGAGTLVAQGLLYLLDACAVDPVTPLVVATAMAVVVALRRRDDAPIAAGMMLQLVYIVRVGGDFMTGRFLTPVFFCAAALLVRLPWRLPRGAAPVAIGALAVLGIFATTRPPVTSGINTYILNANDGMNAAGISDERVFYYRYTGLLRWNRDRPLPWNEQVRIGQELRASPRIYRESSVGMTGYFAGPNVHIIDEYALGDAFLARLPVQPGWRIGHFLRTSPPGYVESVASGHNQLADTTQAFLYERLRTITQGPLWSRRRWRAIAALNFGR